MIKLDFESSKNFESSFFRFPIKGKAIERGNERIEARGRNEASGEEEANERAVRTSGEEEANERAVRTNGPAISMIMQPSCGF